MQRSCADVNSPYKRNAELPRGPLVNSSLWGFSILDLEFSCLIIIPCHYPQFFLPKFNMFYKNAAFCADFESVEKVAKKVNSKKWQKNGVFYFYCCMQKLSVTSLVWTFLNFFFIGFGLSIWFLRFMVPIPNFGKNAFFAYFSAFC